MPKNTKKIRLDQVVQTRAGVSRSKAQGLILTGNVSGRDGERLMKPGQRVDEDIEIVIAEGQRFVGRGGEKLEAAFEHFGLDVEGAIAIDVGASTGGFTDCMLQHGAAKVYAVDVGYGQLDWSLQQDARVVAMDRTNIRNLTPGDLDEQPTFFTADCSFISLKLVLPPLFALLARPCEGVALIKPQFEAGKDQVGKGGVVRDSAVHEAVVERVTAFCTELGFAKTAVIPSPLLGPAGNKEFLIHLAT